MGLPEPEGFDLIISFSPVRQAKMEKTRKWYHVMFYLQDLDVWTKFSITCPWFRENGVGGSRVENNAIHIGLKFQTKVDFIYFRHEKTIYEKSQINLPAGCQK